MKQLQRMLALPALLAAAAAGPLAAQVGERNAAAAAQPSQAADGEDARAKLNEQQAQFAQGQLDTNAASQAEYESRLKAVADARAKIASDNAAAQAAYEAEKARREAEYQAAMDKWRADVAACEAGDVSRCAKQTVPAPA